MEYIKARTIVNRNKPNSWFGYEYTMNIYKGCNHGCIYCDSRCDCYRVKDFDTVKAKENALEIIRDDLRRKVNKGVICSGAMSDPYNSFEKDLLLTRHALELIYAFEFGVSIITKSCLVTRDIDILQDIKSQAAVMVKMTITTGDDALGKILEPGAPTSSERFSALKQLTDAGIFAGILMMPQLPFVHDTEENIDMIVAKAVESGAKFIYPRFGVTLRGNQKEWFFHHLDQKFPGLKDRYIETFGNKIYCNSPDSRKLYHYFKKKCNDAGLLYEMESIIKESRKGFTYDQLSIFDIAKINK